jgi:hypothetical protein
MFRRVGPGSSSGRGLFGLPLRLQGRFHPSKSIAPFENGPRIPNCGQPYELVHRTSRSDGRAPPSGQYMKGEGFHDPPLDDSQLNELFSGVFPADYPQDVIHLRTDFEQFSLLKDAFEHSKDRSVTVCCFRLLSEFTCAN